MHEMSDKTELNEIPNDLKINFEAKSESGIRKIYQSLSDFLTHSDSEAIIIQYIDDICLNLCVPLSLSATLSKSIFKKSEFIFSQLIKYAPERELFTGMV